MGFPLNLTFFIFQLTVRPLKNPVLSVLISSHLLVLTVDDMPELLNIHILMTIII